MTSSRPAAVVVVGSINLDLITHVATQPRPGETVLGHDLIFVPGGKGANQAVAAAKLLAATSFTDDDGGQAPEKVALVGAVGSDEFAQRALAGLEAAGVDLDQVAHVPGPTGLALITVSEAGENSIVVVPGANATLDAAQVRASRDLLWDAEVIVVQGEIPAAAIAAVAAEVKLANGRLPEAGATRDLRLIVNLAPVAQVAPEVLRAARPLVVNEHEALGALALLGLDAPTASDNYFAIARLLVHAGVPEVVVTLGASGALVAWRHKSEADDEVHLVEVPAPEVTAVDTTGAGDAFVGALAARLAAGDDLVSAARYAVRVGAYAVQGEGAQPSYPDADAALPGSASDG